MIVTTTFTQLHHLAMTIVKDEQERPVPVEWRSTLSSVVEAFGEGDFQLARGVAPVRPVSEKDAKKIAANIADYGTYVPGQSVHLSTIPEKAWESSVYQWMGGFWDVLVDLYTLEEGRCDLVLTLRVYEAADGCSFEVGSVYVP